MPDLPPYAKQWALQWKQASAALQAIRDQELRQPEGGSSGVAASHLVYVRSPERRGLVEMADASGTVASTAKAVRRR